MGEGSAAGGNGVQQVNSPDCKERHFLSLVQLQEVVLQKKVGWHIILQRVISNVMFSNCKGEIPIIISHLTRQKPAYDDGIN